MCMAATGLACGKPTDLVHAIARTSGLEGGTLVAALAANGRHKLLRFGAAAIPGSINKTMDFA